MLHAKLAGVLSRRAGARLFRLFERTLDAGALEPSAGAALRFLPEGAVLRLCDDAQLALRPEGFTAAYARGDLCIGAFTADVLAGYCWIAFAPLPHLDGVWVKFD